jgi:hypothetical protein
MTVALGAKANDASEPHVGFGFAGVEISSTGLVPAPPSCV